MSQPNRSSTPVTNIISLDSEFTDQHTIIINKTEISNDDTIIVNLNNTDYINLFNVHTAFSSGIVADHDKLLENFRIFFNIQSNVNKFADDLFNKLNVRYPQQLYINKRKLRNLCKSDGLIWNNLFKSHTIFKDTNDVDRPTFICEEIALDFKDSIEQDEYSNGDPEKFWSEVHTGDNVTIRFTLNLGTLVPTNNKYNVFLQFAYDSVGTYNYSI